MTTISSGNFNISAFQKMGMTVTNKKMTDEELEKFKLSQGIEGAIELGEVKQFDPASARKLSTEEIEKFEQIWKDQFKIMADPTQADNHPSNIYATVKVNGEVVATLYNSGGAMTSNATAGKLSKLPSMGEGETLVGPELAQKRAEEIAKALGGKVEVVGTALTQAQWNARPPVEFTYDYEAMAAAEKERKNSAAAAQDASAKTKVDTQIIAQNGIEEKSAVEEKPAISNGSVESFLKFMDDARNNPGGFMRAAFLASRGLTEEDVAAMGPEERQKLEEEIKNEIKKKTGASDMEPTSAITA